MKSLLCFLLATGAASASSIAIFSNSSFTGSPNVANVSSVLTGQGHTTSTFSSLTGWTGNLSAANLAIIPDLDADLFAALSPAEQSAIAAFVSGGRNLLVTGGAGGPGDTNAFLNGIFGFSLVPTGPASSSIDNGAVTGTPFAGGPASLPATNQVFLHQTSSLPGGALNLYHNATTSSVWSASFGSGRVVYLAYDWFSGSQASWDSVLGRAVTYAATDIPSNVPEPSAFGLTAAALPAAVVSGRRARR